MGLEALMQPGRSMLDIGTQTGFQSAYLAARYGMDIVGYDIPIANAHCNVIRGSPFTVNFFDGNDIPEEANSYDAVSFIHVLHHAAKATEQLLQQAATIARKWIIIGE